MWLRHDLVVRRRVAIAKVVLAGNVGMYDTEFARDLGGDDFRGQ
jgi:hypothetical protein